jgi:hypothetical protein
MLGIGENKMLKNNFAKIVIITSMVSVLTPISAFAVYDSEGNYIGDKEYNYTLIPVNTETATKDGSSNIKIIQGDMDSFTLTAKGSSGGLGNYTTNVAEFAKGCGSWLYVTLVSDKYGEFTVFAGYRENNGQLCALVSKGTTGVNSQGTKIEFTEDVVFRFNVNFTEHNNNYDVSENTSTGWYKDDGCWYYTKADGDDAIGWTQIDGKWYYFYKNGAMASNTYIEGYYIDNSGVWVK